jgi:hypothetical protein
MFLHLDHRIYRAAIAVAITTVVAGNYVFQRMIRLVTERRTGKRMRDPLAWNRLSYSEIRKEYSEVFPDGSLPRVYRALMILSYVSLGLAILVG